MSGKPNENWYHNTELFEPPGMKDTGFTLKSTQKIRFAPSCRYDGDEREPWPGLVDPCDTRAFQSGGGMAGTWMLVDPAEQLGFLFMTQMFPPDYFSLRRKCVQILYGALCYPFHRHALIFRCTFNPL